MEVAGKIFNFGFRFYGVLWFLRQIGLAICPINLPTPNLSLVSWWNPVITRNCFERVGVLDEFSILKQEYNSLRSILLENFSAKNFSAIFGGAEETLVSWFSPSANWCQSG